MGAWMVKESEQERSTVRVLIVDDHEAALHGFAVTLGQLAWVEVVGQYRTSQELLEALGQTAVDLVLLDYSLSSSCMDGLALIAAIRKGWPDVKMLVTSSRDDRLTIEHCIRQGAHGFFTKNQDIRALLIAIEALASGDFYVPPAMPSMTETNGELR